MGIKDTTSSLLYFSAILSGVLFFATGMFAAHNVTPDDNQLQDLSKDLGNDVSESQGSLEDNTRNIDSGLEAGLFYLRGFFDIIVTLFQLGVNIPSIGYTFISALNLPTWTTALISIPFFFYLLTLAVEASRNS